MSDSERKAVHSNKIRLRSMACALSSDDDSDFGDICELPIELETKCRPVELDYAQLKHLTRPTKTASTFVNEVSWLLS